MSIFEDNELAVERSYFITKDNMLITHSRYSMTLAQQRLLLYMVSRIKPDDRETQVYEFDVKTFSRVCGYDEQNGYYYRGIKQDMQNIADTSAWIEIRPGREELFRWLDQVWIDKNSGVIRYTFHASVRPYLFGLQENYTRYSLYNVLAMRCKYSIRLYEFLMKEKYRKKFVVPLDTLRVRIDATGYKEYKNFRTRVIDPAIEEIENYTEIHVSYQPIKTGRAVTAIEFTVEDKTNVEYLSAMKSVECELDSH